MGRGGGADSETGKGDSWVVGSISVACMALESVRF